jgi:hypothetical protein
MPKYLVETVSMFRMRYVVEADEQGPAADAVLMQEAEEFGQKHLDETIFGVREVTDEEIPKLFFEDHPYLEEGGPERAFQNITKIST